MKVAIVHYWLISRRGGERVVEALSRLYPEADIFTHVFDPIPFERTLAGHAIHTTFVNRLPFSRHLLEQYLCLMPLALEQIDLRGYDLVISSESGPAKGVIVDPEALHVCYCHSPMRYAWDLYSQYISEAGFVKRMGMRGGMHYLRQWDQLSAQRPDVIVANSEHTRLRIAKYWRRESIVIAPPVEIGRFAQAATTQAPGDYYLCAGQLMGYKRVDLAVDAFTQAKLPLLVVGKGPELRRLKLRAGPTVRFARAASDDEFAAMIAGCRALVFPGEEDFGIVPVEAMAAGRPVIAFRRGGAMDSVVDGMSGIFFDEQSPSALLAAVQRFERERSTFTPAAIALHAAKFGEGRFATEFKATVSRHLQMRPRRQSSEFSITERATRPNGDAVG